MLGLNYRMTDVAASMGLSQLKKLNKYVKARNIIAKKYNKILNKKYFYVPEIPKNILSTFHLYVIKVKHKYINHHEKFFNYLRNNKINVNLHYIPVHLHPYYKKLGFKKGDYKVSERHAESSVSIPIFPGLKSNEFKKISNLINKFFVKLDKK